MARTKVFAINLSEDQKAKLKNALAAGSPLTVALTYAKIPSVQYYYYVEVANVSRYFKEMEFVKLDDETIKAGVSFADIREESQELNSFSVNRNGGIATFKEPSEKAKQRYRTNRTFKAFADEVYDFINECDTLRSEAVLYHLNEIRKAAGKRGVNTNSSQWFLERAVPEHFGRNDRITQKIESNVHSTFSAEGDLDKPALPPIKVEFINPNANDSVARLKEMEEKIKDQVLGKDAA